MTRFRRPTVPFSRDAASLLGATVQTTRGSEWRQDHSGVEIASISQISDDR
jgi:hypothetical protein